MKNCRLTIASLMSIVCVLLGVTQARVAYGQNEAAAVIGATYEFVAPTVVVRYNYLLKKAQTKAGSLELGRTGNVFRLIDENDTSYVIRFFAWKNDSNGRNKVLVDSGMFRPLFFVMPKTGFSTRVKRVYAPWRKPEIAGGAVIIPIKLRSKPFDFSRDFSLGFAAGPRWRISRTKENYFMVLGAFNVNIVTVDSASTKGKMLRAADKGALGFAVGGVLDFDGIQVGLFAGKDYLSYRDLVATDWIYNHKTWIAAGVGFTIFSKGSNGATAPAGAAVNQDKMKP